ncbi:MAG TPA: hypothetical protein VG934_00445 [Candidatus Paceibacterota bacterium]|nr:hypothetical protein [Candidatus Paceibacterota bacterium]
MPINWVLLAVIVLAAIIVFIIFFVFGAMKAASDADDEIERWEEEAGLRKKSDRSSI